MGLIFIAMIGLSYVTLTSEFKFVLNVYCIRSKIKIMVVNGLKHFFINKKLKNTDEFEEKEQK